ncbi:hypothetical protein FCR2A7T_14610 [Flavobacterium cauense R2A-7]|nr:hypothetical protein FCR2A7T_14610 [Flavobacterium cauense R2A-7]
MPQDKNPRRWASDLIIVVYLDLLPFMFALGIEQLFELFFSGASRN